MEILLEETTSAYYECDAACAALKEFIDSHATSMNDNELKKVCDALEMMLKRRATLKSRMKYFGE